MLSGSDLPRDWHGRECGQAGERVVQMMEPGDYAGPVVSSVAGCRRDSAIAQPKPGTETPCPLSRRQKRRIRSCSERLHGYDRPSSPCLSRPEQTVLVLPACSRGIKSDYNSCCFVSFSCGSIGQ